MTEALEIRCSTLDEARHVVRLLVSHRVPAEAIEVLSAEPIHEIGDAVSGRSRLPVYVLAGAAWGIAGGWALASLTARWYPINTGGMPIVSGLPAGIVTYEAMMLLAVLFTLAGLLIEGRLLRRRPAERPETVEAMLDGDVYVRARVPPEEAESLRFAVEGSRSSMEV